MMILYGKTKVTLFGFVLLVTINFFRFSLLKLYIKYLTKFDSKILSQLQ